MAIKKELIFVRIVVVRVCHDMFVLLFELALGLVVLKVGLSISEGVEIFINYIALYLQEDVRDWMNALGLQDIYLLSGSSLDNPALLIIALSVQLFILQMRECKAVARMLVSLCLSIFVSLGRFRVAENSRIKNHLYCLYCHSGD